MVRVAEPWKQNRFCGRTVLAGFATWLKVLTASSISVPATCIQQFQIIPAMIALSEPIHKPRKRFGAGDSASLARSRRGRRARRGGSNRSLRTHCWSKTGQRFGAERQFFIGMFPAEADWRAEAGAIGA